MIFQEGPRKGPLHFPRSSQKWPLAEEQPLDLVERVVLAVLLCERAGAVAHRGVPKDPVDCGPHRLRRRGRCLQVRADPVGRDPGSCSALRADISATS